MERNTDRETYERLLFESCRPHPYLTFAPHTPIHHEPRDEEIPTHAASIFRSHIPALCTPRQKALHRHHGISTALAHLSLGLVLDVLGSLLQVEVALLVRPAGAEAGANKGGPRAALEEEDGEDDAEADAEGGLDEEVREAAVPL